MTGTASDDVGVARVEVSVDSGSFRVADGIANWAYLLDSTSYADGNHTVAARATDASGNVSTTSEVVNVQNAVAPPLAPAVTARVLAPGTIGGFAFEEPNRDGVYQTDEQQLAGEHLFLYPATGTYLRNTYSDASGWYAFHRACGRQLSSRVRPRILVEAQRRLGPRHNRVDVSRH